MKAHLVTELEDDIALLLIHNPQLRNALSKEVVSDCLGARAELAMAADLRIAAAKASRLGFVECVVPASQLWDAAMAVATKLARRSRLAVSLAREALNLSSQARLEAGCAFVASQFGLSVCDALLNQPVASVLGNDGGCR